MKEEKITIKNLLSSVLLLIVGILLLTDSNNVISVLSWVIGAILVIIGIIKFITYFKTKKDYPDYEPTDLIISILAIILGLVLAFVPNIMNIGIRLVFGGWIFIEGINRLILAISVKGIDDHGYKVYLISSLVMLLIGLFVLFNLFGIIGIYLILYSISDIIGYIYSTTKNNKQRVIKSKKKKIKKSVKEKKAIDAEIVK